jgi:ppGpp synthetase/RelA/SpoT-type nucleotidyltranferase
MSLEEKYKDIRPRYERLATEIEDALKRKIKEAKIKIASITSRTKTVESFLDKSERKPYSDPLIEITDLAGCRVVCLYELDIERVERIIQDEFKICEKFNKYKEAGLDKMGYLGIHFIVELRDNYSGPRYDGLHGLKCEIQVRTILQDAWAIINHHLIYKNESAIPDPLKRDINNVAALLEIAQGIFDKVPKVVNQYVEEIQSKVKNQTDFLNQPVDDETLRIYTKLRYKNLPIKVNERIHSLILRDLDLGKYPTLKAIDETIKKAKPAVELYYSEAPDLFKAGTDFITKSLGFVDDDFLRKHPFCQRTRDAIKRLRHLVR